MFENKTEKEARQIILDQVSDYAQNFHQRKKYQKRNLISHGMRMAFKILLINCRFKKKFNEY